MRHSALVPAALLVAAMTAPGQPASGEKLFSSTRHDFGTVPRGAELHYRFCWVNRDKTRREITELRTTCGCASATPLPRVVEPGQTGVIEVLVDARRFVGPKTVHVHLMIGPDHAQAVVLELTANSRTDVVYNPGHVNFGVVAEGATPIQQLEVEYAGALDWRLQEVVNTSPHLTVSQEEMYRRPGQAGYRLKVGLHADVPSGEFKHELQLKTNDPANPVLPLLVEANVRPSIVVVPDPVYFGSVRLNHTANRRVTIRGDRPFRILRVEGMGKGLAATPPSGSAAVHALQLAWQPQEAGEVNLQLVIHTDLERHPVLRVTVQGEAIP